MLENGAVAPLLEGLKHKKYEVRSASVFALGELRGGAARVRCLVRCDDAPGRQPARHQHGPGCTLSLCEYAARKYGRVRGSAVAHYF